jgi:hypothetical protein
MSYQLIKALTIGAINLIKIGSNYYTYISFTNGQYIMIDVQSFYYFIINNNSLGTYPTDYSNFNGKFIAVGSSGYISDISIWDVLTHEQFTVHVDGITKRFNEYEYGFFSRYSMETYYGLNDILNNNLVNTSGRSEDGNLIYSAHGLYQSPPVCEYSVSTKTWLYKTHNTDDELDRVAARLISNKFTLTFTPANLFDGKYVLPTCQGDTNDNIMYDYIKATIIADPTLPDLYDAANDLIKYQRIFVHRDDEKNFEDVATANIRIFYKCTIAGNERWCLADLKNIDAASIYVSDAISPYESYQFHPDSPSAIILPDLEAWSSLTAVAYTCTATFHKHESDTEGFWMQYIYGYGAGQFSKFHLINSYTSQGGAITVFTTYTDRETGVCLHPDLIDRRHFNHPVFGVITREEGYFRNGTYVFYICNLHNQYGYDNQDRWIAFTKDYLGNWCFPRYDHALQAYGSKFIYLDPTDLANLYHPIGNPMGIIIRAISEADYGGSIQWLDLTDDDSYYTHNGIDYFNVFDEFYLAIERFLETDRFTIDVSIFNDISNIVVRKATITNIKTVIGSPMNIYENASLIIATGQLYQPTIIYDINDLSKFAVLTGEVSTYRSIFVNDRYVILVGYPGVLKIIDTINGILSLNTNQESVTTNVKDVNQVTKSGNFIYWVARQRRVLNQYEAIQFGVASWQEYLSLGTLSTVKPDCAYDMNFDYSMDLRNTQLGLTEESNTNAIVEAAVLAWIATYKELGETDDQARDRLITLLKGTYQYLESGMDSDDDYVFIGLQNVGYQAMIGCNFEDSFGILHTNTDDIATSYPKIKLIYVNDVTSVIDLDDKTRYHNIEIQGLGWVGITSVGQLRLCGDYVFLFPEHLQQTDVIAEWDGTYWCIPVYYILKSTLIAAIPAGFIAAASFTKMLIPSGTTAAYAREAFGVSIYSYHFDKDNYDADNIAGEIYATIRSNLSFVNGLGQTIVPWVVKINPATDTYTFVCGQATGVFSGSLVSYNRTKDILWVTYGETSYRLASASSQTLALLT